MGCAQSSPAGDRRHSCCRRRRGSSGCGGRRTLGGVRAGATREEDEGEGGRKEFYLPNTGLRFSRRQMERLDFKLTRLAATAIDGDGSNGDWVGGEGAADGGASALAESSIERLLQRLVCAVGMLDPRFASKFLVSINEPERQRRRKSNVSRCLSYLVRVDALSTPELYPDDEDVEERGGRPTCILQEGGGGGEGSTGEEGAGGRRMPVTPQGFARVRLQGEGVETWAEFIGQDGYLRSDKVQEHFVSLLSKAASLEATSTVFSASANKESFPPPPPPPPPPPLCPLDVDESMFCGSPGKIVDPWTLHHIIKDLSPSQQCYYGPAKMNQNRFPDPRDFHISITRRSPSVDLLISPLSPTMLTSKTHQSNRCDPEADCTIKEPNQCPPRHTIKVSLTLGIGFDSWPQTADFPYRISLGHINALHYYQSALGGFYLVPGKPHHTLRCESPRTSVWLMSLPATELALLSHWCPTQSSTGRSLAAVDVLLEGIQGRGPGRKMLGGAMSSGKEKQVHLRRVTTDLLHTVHLLHLEKESRGVTRTGGIGGSPDSDWNSPGTSVSMQALLVLDSIIGALRTQRQRHLIFSRCNMVLLNTLAQQEVQPREKGRGKARKLRPMPQSTPHNRVSNFWQNALVMSGNFTPEDSSSGSEDEDECEEEEFLHDASHIESAVRCLHLLASPLGEPLEEDRDGEGAEDYQRRIEVEIALSKKWQGTLLGLVPTPLSDSSLTSVPIPSPSPASLFSSRYLSSLPASAYSTRQLKYIQEVIRQMLKVKQITNQEQQNVIHGISTLHSEGPIEELVYIFSSLLDPFNTNLDGVSMCSAKREEKRRRWRKRESSKPRSEQGMKRWKGNGNLFSIGKSKELNEAVLGKWSEAPYFPGKRVVINKTINAMVHDSETLAADLSDDNSFVFYLLKWLVRAKKEEEKLIQSSNTQSHDVEEAYIWNRHSKSLSRWCCLGGKRKGKDGYLMSYLSMLYASSLENGIHLEEYLRHEEEKKQELLSFGMWCDLVVEGQIFPDEGAYDACCKGWKWAQSVLETVKIMTPSGSIQLILTPKRGTSVRQSFTGPHSKDSLCYSFDQLYWSNSLSLPRSRAGATLPNRTQTAKAKEFLTLHLQRGKFPQVNTGTGSKPLHCYVRDSNPISRIIDMSHRRGFYRGLGTPVAALIAMHKFSVLQEISSLLPEDERQQVLDSIHRVSKVTRRRCRPQRHLCNVTGIDYGKYKMKYSEAERHNDRVILNKNSDGFGTVNDALSTKKGSAKRIVVGRVLAEQHLDEVDDRSEDVKENLQYLCRVIMGQQLIKGTREIGLAHGVRNFAMISCNLNNDKGIHIEDSLTTTADDMNTRERAKSDRKWNKNTKEEMVTKL